MGEWAIEPFNICGCLEVVEQRKIVNTTTSRDGTWLELLGSNVDLLAVALGFEGFCCVWLMFLRFGFFYYCSGDLSCLYF
jgi:hypothetical protein